MESVIRSEMQDHHFGWEWLIGTNQYDTWGGDYILTFLILHFIHLTNITSKYEIHAWTTSEVSSHRNTKSLAYLIYKRFVCSNSDSFNRCLWLRAMVTRYYVLLYSSMNFNIRPLNILSTHQCTKKIGKNVEGKTLSIFRSM